MNGSVWYFKSYCNGESCQYAGILIALFSNPIISAYWRKWMSQTGTSQSQNGSCWGPNGKRCPASSHEEDECWSSVGQCSVGAKHHHHNCRWWWHLKYCLQITWKCGGFFAYKVFSLQKKKCLWTRYYSEIIIKHCNFFQPILNWNDFGKVSLYCTLLIYWGEKSYHLLLILSKEMLFLKCFMKSGWFSNERRCLGA